ncbi:Fic family protein [Microbacterium sp. NPDC087868]|uniref:Fic family protein n=1 Tax=Microbacterium sp. NPDC087868 TaxID=3364195 RepID=UPI00384FBBB9
MDLEAFGASPVGSLVPIAGHDARFDRHYNYSAFVPAPLPAAVSLSPETLVVMSEADRALGHINARVQFLPNPALLVRPVLATEAKATSAIEGTYATLDEILTAEYVDGNTSREVREVRNYIEAALRALSLIDDLPISRRLIEPLHAILIRGTRGDGYDAGSIRQRQVFVGEEDAPVEEARFVPAPPGRILELGFSDWERWINDDGVRIPLLARVAMAHYQFETLHPFSDGNGRLGRLIITLQLIAAGELTHPVLNLSAWFEPRKAEYIDALRDVSISGDFDRWIRVFCIAVKERADAAVATVNRLFEYRDDLVARATAAGYRRIGVEIGDFLLGQPVFSVNELHNGIGVAINTAARRIAELEELGVVREVTGSSYGRLYFASHVARLLEAPH